MDPYIYLFFLPFLLFDDVCGVSPIETEPSTISSLFSDFSMTYKSKYFIIFKIIPQKTVEKELFNIGKYNKKVIENSTFNKVINLQSLHKG